LPGRWKFWLWGGFALSLAALPILWLGLVTISFLASGSSHPGVRVQGIPVGGRNAAEMAAVLETVWEREHTLVVTDGTHSWAAAPSELGLRIDTSETARRALAVGRGDHAFLEMLWLARFGEINVSPAVVFDPAAARAGLEALAIRTNRPAKEAALRLENGRWEAVSGQYGANLDIDATLQQIAQGPKQILEARTLHLVTYAVAPRVMDLSPALAELQQTLQQPVTLQAHDPITGETHSIPVSPETLAQWMRVTPGPEGLQVALDGAKMEAYAQSWATALAPGRALEPFTPPADLTERWQMGVPITLIVRHASTTYTVQPGDTLARIAYQVGMPYWKIQQANPGIQADALFAGQSLVIPSPNEMLPLPVVTNQRIVISIQQQRLWTYQDGALRSEHRISTGIERSPTLPGVYQIRTHEPLAYASVWDLTMPHFMGIYEGWPGFFNGIHGLPTLSNGRLLWAGALGRPASYGCIILSLAEAEDLYHWAEEGTVVEIQP
jgi:LysM repeat protein